MANIAELQWTLLAALLLNAASLCTCAFVDLAKIHEYMTKEELSTTFNVEAKEEVTDYEVVSIVFHQNRAHRNRRSAPPGHHVVTIKELTLYLEPVDHVLLGEDTPVYLASGNASYPHGIRYENTSENTCPKSLSLHQDPENQAAITMWKHADGKVNLEGLIGDMVVKPLPQRFKRRTSSNDHIIYREKSLDKFFTPASYLDISYWSKTPVSFPPWDIVDTVYPEILVIADYSTYLDHGKNLQALCKYMAAFWNGVDLRYRVFKQPKVRLSIAGLIVVTDENGAPYMTKYHLEKTFLRGLETIHESAKYFPREKRFEKDTYDVAIAITSYELCREQTESNICNIATTGLSPFGGACLHDQNPDDRAVAVIEDHRIYDGVLTAAHEIGHMMGAWHDIPTEDDLERCHEGFHFLMSQNSGLSPNVFLFSDCSISEITYFLRAGAECLRNKPVVNRPIAKKLPGELLSRDEQCSHYDNRIKCEDDDELKWNECRSLYCQYPRSLFMRNVWPFADRCDIFQQPLEGTPCSGGGICLDGVCVHEEEKSNEG